MEPAVVGREADDRESQCQPGRRETYRECRRYCRIPKERTGTAVVSTSYDAATVDCGLTGGIMRLSPKKIAIMAAAGLAVAIIPAAPALAMPVCGDTLLVNTTLTADLTCAGNALKIGAAGIIL